MGTLIAYIIAMGTISVTLGLFGMAVMSLLIDWQRAIAFGVAGVLIVIVGYFFFARIKGWD